ncbi:MAG: hypothetical protein EXS18_02090 [Verrucomicrobiae bacterium]|nr:hypothetical protein [Verrucomicrobiae bacterium]
METSHEQEADSMNPQASPSQRSNLEMEINSLRVSSYVLGVGLLFFSICFNLYTYKQNNLLIAQIDSQTRMLNQNEPLFESNRQLITMMAPDLRTFAETHADLVPILVNHNIVRIQASR